MARTTTRPSRRTFLQRAARVAAAWSAAPALFARAVANVEAAAAMRFGLVTYLWAKDWDLATLIESCEKAEVLGVELRTTHKHGVEPSLGASDRRDVRKRFADSPVTLVGLGSNESFDHVDPSDLEKAMEKARAFIQLSHDVGGTGVKVKPNRFHEGVPREKTIAQIGESLNRLGKFAADLGQEVRLEVHGECSPLPIMRDIMAIATHPAVGVCWNSNGEDLSGKGLEHNFHLVKDRFGKTAHVRELDDDRYPYAKLMELFCEMDYDGWILLEARGEPRDRVKALGEQRAIFEKLVSRGRAAVSPQKGKRQDR